MPDAVWHSCLNPTLCLASILKLSIASGFKAASIFVYLYKQMQTSSLHPLHLVECPRDAMQGWKTFIPTQKKIEYLNALLAVGFDTLDCGSFVSPKVIPQMADTKDVLPKLDNSDTK